MVTYFSDLILIFILASQLLPPSIIIQGQQLDVPEFSICLSSMCKEYTERGNGLVVSQICRWQAVIYNSQIQSYKTCSEVSAKSTNAKKYTPKGKRTMAYWPAVRGRRLSRSDQLSYPSVQWPGLHRLWHRCSELPKLWSGTLNSLSLYLTTGLVNSERYLHSFVDSLMRTGARSASGDKSKQESKADKEENRN